MTQGGPRSSLVARIASIPPSARPSAEHVRALAAAGVLEIRLLRKIAQRPLMSVWAGVDKAAARVLVTVVDACGTEIERARVIRSAEALLVLTNAVGVQRLHCVAPEVDAFVSDFLGAGTAADLLVLRWSAPQRLAFAGHVCEALVAVHEAGLVHGCLCPDNILLNDELRPVLTEVGMVSIAESLDGDEESLFGYGAYAAPAARRGQSDVATDIFSVGRLLSFVMTDRAPVDNDFGEIDARSPELSPIVRRCAGVTEPPYASMAALAADIERCRQRLAVAGGEVGERRPEVAVVPRASPRIEIPSAATWIAKPATTSPRWWVAAIAAATLVVIAVTVGGSSRLDDEDAGARGQAARVFVEHGGKDLRKKRLQSADFSKLDLEGVDLEASDLTMASFAGAKLSGARIDGASFLLTNLAGADLTGVELGHAVGIETATCDAATVTPPGWYCNAESKLRRGPTPP